ncbi:unnamed protein product [Phytophthora fragariaefolia]|uniref:Unnamed protein product n=1 Tax=Phytophthora fragariaefolia TaxID=1490495 RepID=A0A9W6TXS8_9STRA|nr:unnamed protein product [Phytophthora fragariaefolia]
MANGTCKRCTVAEQMKVPCRHIQAVVFWRSKQESSDLPEYDAKNYFYKSYTVSTMWEAFESIAIVLPLYDTLEITDQVKPPPLYRQAGRSCMRPKEVSLFTRGTKRKPNRGECTGSSTWIMRPPAAKTGPYGCDDSDDETKAIAAYFNEQVKGARTIKRKDYTCSRCNQIGHNVRSCTTPLTEIEESGVGIVSGLYVIGECPFIACGMRDEYEREVQRYR